ANLMKGSTLARDIERQRETVGVRDLIVGRSVMDCWMPVGRFAGNLLNAAKCALSALILTEVHPLVDLWDVQAPDAWGLVLVGVEELQKISLDEGPLEYDDYAVVPDKA